MKSFTRFTIKVLSIYFFVFLIINNGKALLYKELNLIGGRSNERGWIDESSMLKNSVGAEYLGKFSNEYGDFMTINLQTRLTYKPLENDWGLEVHNAWLEYNIKLGNKLRIGHFDPFYGLEPLLDTHGTLLQTLAHKNIGFKSDWGIGFRRFFKKFDYETAIQLGSGMKIKYDGNFLFTQRIGTFQKNNPTHGLSFLYGKILMDEITHGNTFDMEEKMILKKRIGLDSQYQIRSMLLKTELNYGKNGSDTVYGLFLEANYPIFKALQSEIQWQTFSQNEKENVLSLSLAYKIIPELTFRTAYFHNFNDEKQIIMQIYYYGR